MLYKAAKIATKPQETSKLSQLGSCFETCNINYFYVSGRTRLPSTKWHKSVILKVYKKVAMPILASLDKGSQYRGWGTHARTGGHFSSCTGVPSRKMKNTLPVFAFIERVEHNTERHCTMPASFQEFKHWDRKNSFYFSGLETFHFTR